MESIAFKIFSEHGSLPGGAIDKSVWKYRFEYVREELYNYFYGDDDYSDSDYELEYCSKSCYRCGRKNTSIDNYYEMCGGCLGTD